MGVNPSLEFSHSEALIRSGPFGAHLPTADSVHRGTSEASLTQKCDALAVRTPRKSSEETALGGSQ